jgi:CRISPR-associated protein Cst2
VVCHLNLARIGFNEILHTYALPMEERLRRAHALLRSTLYTFIQPNGAMRSAQAPHILGFSGVLTHSNKPVPAPTVSPLTDQYAEEIERTAGVLNAIEGEGTIGGAQFDAMGEFAGIINNILAEMTLYEYRV